MSRNAICGLAIISRNAFAILEYPIIRNILMAKLRKVAITRGPDLVRTLDLSLSKVKSLT